MLLSSFLFLSFSRDIHRACATTDLPWPESLRLFIEAQVFLTHTKSCHAYLDLGLSDTGTVNSANICLASGCRRSWSGADLFVEKHSWSILPFHRLESALLGYVEVKPWVQYFLGSNTCRPVRTTVNQVLLWGWPLFSLFSLWWPLKSVPLVGWT